MDNVVNNQNPDEVEGNLIGFPFDDLVDTVFDEFSRSLQDAFDSRFHFFVQEFSKYLSYKDDKVLDLDTEWVKIDSLSKIRAEVGGRFQNLRDRWVNSGFPLKEKKGEKIVTGEINQEAWDEFVNWLMKQDCLVRLAPVGSDYYFEIKHKSENKE